MLSKELIREADRIADECKVCSVASVSENGYPRICYLSPLKNNGVKEFWFSTGTNSTKVQHFNASPKASVSIQREGDSITLLGNMDIVKSKEDKDSLWQEWLARHFPNGGKDDPDYCIIHFIANEGTIYIADQFETGQI